EPFIFCLVEDRQDGIFRKVDVGGRFVDNRGRQRKFFQVTGERLFCILPFKRKSQQLVIELPVEKAIGVGQVRRRDVVVSCPDKVFQDKSRVGGHPGILPLPSHQMRQDTICRQLTGKRSVPLGGVFIIIVPQLLLVIYAVTKRKVGSGSEQLLFGPRQYFVLIFPTFIFELSVV